jgi:hypothetical protein
MMIDEDGFTSVSFHAKVKPSYMIWQKAHVNHLESQSPCTETLFENLMDLKSVREALLGLTGR